MVKVFAFSLFGSQDKYCKGVQKNVELINIYFPEWKIWIYIGNDVPTNIINLLENNYTVKLIYTNAYGNENKFYRYLPIDDESVEICIIRDADSRVYERDRYCIHDFINSDKLAHIIRDHQNHVQKVMAGMWGIKKELLGELKVYDIIQDWKKTNTVSEFWDDTNILCEKLYPLMLSSLLVHDDYNNYEPLEIKKNFLVSNGDSLHFIGQVYEYNEEGNEFPKFKDCKKAPNKQYNSL